MDNGGFPKFVSEAIERDNQIKVRDEGIYARRLYEAAESVIWSMVGKDRIYRALNKEIDCKCIVCQKIRGWWAIVKENE